MVKLEGVTKTFKKAVVVQEVTAEFRQGEITGIVGRNGSGKTVLFKIQIKASKFTLRQFLKIIFQLLYHNYLFLY